MTPDDITRLAAMNGLPAIIKRERERSGLSLRGLAKMTGLSHPYLSQLETSQRDPSISTIRKLAKAFGWSATTVGILVMSSEDEKSE